jgi:S-adenosylmethionine hydrolase
MAAQGVKTGQTPIISLLTDFGSVDSYVSEMKAVILSICPSAKIIDISHQVEKFNIRMGSFLLASASPAFPVDTVHVAVVDPGVGSARRPIAVQTVRSVYVGPDNGLLIPAAQEEKILHVYEIQNRSLMRDETSGTFHGRDIFAPVAAHLACGSLPSETGTEISDYVIGYFTQAKTDEQGLACEVFHIDVFGNVITNARRTQLTQLKIEPGEKVRMLLGRKRVSVRYVKTYSDLQKKEYGLLLGSHGFLEIACREGSAANRIGARTGAYVRFSSASGHRSVLAHGDVHRQKSA